MDLQITTRNLDLTDGLRAYLEKRLNGLERYSNHIIDGEVIIEEERGRYKFECIIKVKGATITAKSQSKDPYEAIDILKDKVKIQLKRYEEKLKSFR